MACISLPLFPVLKPTVFSQLLYSLFPLSQLLFLQFSTWPAPSFLKISTHTLIHQPPQTTLSSTGQPQHFSQRTFCPVATLCRFRHFYHHTLSSTYIVNIMLLFTVSVLPLEWTLLTYWNTPGSCYGIWHMVDQCACVHLLPIIFISRQQLSLF